MSSLSPTLQTGGGAARGKEPSGGPTSIWVRSWRGVNAAEIFTHWFPRWGPREVNENLPVNHLSFGNYLALFPGCSQWKTHLKEYTQNVGGREQRGTQTGRARFCPADSSNMHTPGCRRTLVTLRGYLCSALGK